MDADSYFLAIRTGDLEALRRQVAAAPELLRATAGPLHAPTRPLRCTGLHWAVHADQLESARVLLDAGVDLEARTTEGRTALHDAIEEGRRSIQELLLERGARVDVCAAAILGRLDLLRALLDRTPELVRDRSTQLSPLGWAAYGNQVATARELLDRGAPLDDDELLCAAAVGHVEVGRLLIERGADPEALGAGAGGSALHVAVCMQYTHDARDFVRMLLDHGVDLDARAANGRTAAELAEARARAQAAGGIAAGDPRYKPFAEIARTLRAARP